ncbi:HNH endonuclease [Arthrobacter phage Caterpillar]|nr:HNH endonuclease [Arthrobacter phage Caterpillar]
MHMWSVIPSFPDYEINEYRDIRLKGTDSWVDQYLGRANFEDAKHLRVRLRRDGLPIANSVEDLFYETFPHLKPKPEEPEAAIKKVAPKKVYKRKAKTKRKPAGRAKPFTDDLGPEWVSIPGFSRYKINREGQVINRRTGHLLALRVSQKGSPNFSLLDDDGVTKARHPERLLSMSFRDLTYKSTIRKSAVYTEMTEWRIIPNKTRYSIHPNGIIRRAERHRVKVWEDDQGRKYVKLKTDGVKGFKDYYVSDLVAEVFGPIMEEAA